MNKGVLIISNLSVGDDTFDADIGSLNVSRARRDCFAGKYQIYTFDLGEVYANNKNISVDADKVAAMMGDRERLFQSPPLICIGEDERIWLIDGHHRVRALMRLGLRECAGYVIEERDAGPYRIYYNGKRIAPWMPK